MASRRLSSYRAKRDFSRTAEPSGSGTVADAAWPRFVVQKHAVRRLHYDLRRERLYGGGTVQIGDRGHWWPQVNGPQSPTLERRPR
jgi:hypothetical protein